MLQSDQTVQGSMLRSGQAQNGAVNNRPKRSCSAPLVELIDEHQQRCRCVRNISEVNKLQWAPNVPLLRCQQKYDTNRLYEKQLEWEPNCILQARVHLFLTDVDPHKCG